MSGFAGCLNFEGRGVDKETLQVMLKAISHRGSGEGGFFGDKNFSVAYIGPGFSGPGAKNDQSAIGSSERITVVCDAEIYNWRELKDILEADGFVFETGSDSEVIRNSYIRWGPGCFNKFNGIFALCIFDKYANELILARDHLGIKPIYFYQSGDVLIFASEIKALLAGGFVPRKIDYQALNDYFSFGFSVIPKTLVRGVERLSPGSYLSCGRHGFRKVQYWDAIPARSKKKAIRYYEEEFSYLLEDSIKLRLKGDGVKGILLSGGIDSSALTYFITRDIPGILTFSIGFKEKERVFDENRNYASLVAEKFSTRHKDMFLEAERTDINQLREITRFNDDLSGYPCMVAEFFLSRFAGDKVEIVYDGTGVEQILGGLDTDKADKALYFYKAFPSWFRNFLAESISKRIPVRDRTPEDLFFRLKKFLYGSKFPPEVAHFKWREIFSEQDKIGLIHPALLEMMNSRSPSSVYEYYYRNAGDVALFEKFLYADQKIILETLLKRLDGVYSASGLSARFPYLDYRFVELCAGLPTELKINGLTNKYMLRRAMRGKLPAWVINRKKRGLTLPLNLWIKGSWRKMINDILFSSSLTGTYFSRSYIEKMIREHNDNREDHSWKIFSLVSFYLWAEIYDIDTK